MQSAPKSIVSAPLKSSRSIQEFRLDFVLEEEFNVDPEFAAQFCRACGLDHAVFEVEQTVHSLVDKFGEADLVVFLKAARPGNVPFRLALLIENKINAGLQPDQALRYRQRGKTGIAEGRWDEYLTVIVAPRSYIDARREAGFMAAVSVETIKTWITSSEPARRAFKLARLDEVIAKKQATGVQVIDPDMTRFRRDYYNFLQGWNERNGTALVLPAPKDTWWDDSWFTMKIVHLPGWVAVRHLARTGLVNLDMRNAVFAKMQALADLVGDDLRVIPSGKYKQHTSIQAAVPAIASFDDFDRDRERVETALLTAKRLLLLFQEHRASFEKAYLAG